MEPGKRAGLSKVTRLGLGLGLGLGRELKGSYFLLNKADGLAPELYVCVNADERPDHFRVGLEYGSS